MLECLCQTKGGLHCLLGWNFKRLQCKKDWDQIEILRCPVTTDVMFELFDSELLIINDATHHVANRHYANESSVFEHREMAHCSYRHYGHAFFD